MEQTPTRSERMKAAWADPEVRAKMSRRPSLTERNQQIAEDGQGDCSKCGQVKPLDQFPQARKNRKGQPRYAYCKTCHSEYQREKRLKKLFNLSLEEYDQILARQNGCCAICKQPPKPPKFRKLSVDHDHKTGLVRGLLCSFCNRALGVFRDNLERFMNTVTYLQAPPATAALGAPRFGIKGRVSNKAKTMKKLNPDLFDRPKVMP